MAVESRVRTLLINRFLTADDRFAIFPASRKANRLAPRNLRQPGAKLRPIAKRIEPPVRREKRLLDGVFGEVTVAEDSDGNYQSESLVTFRQLSVRFPVPFAGKSNQF